MVERIAVLLAGVGEAVEPIPERLGVVIVPPAKFEIEDPPLPD